MGKFFTIILSVLFGLNSFAQVSLTHYFAESVNIPTTDLHNFDSNRLKNYFESDLPEPLCSRGESKLNSFFSFILDESGEANVQVKFDEVLFFGLSLYYFENNELIELECNAYKSDLGFINIYNTPERNLSGKTIYARLWGPENIANKTANISIVNKVQYELMEKSTLTILPNAYTPEQLVLDILVSGCVEAYNVQYTGHNDAIGYFDNAFHLIGLMDGIIMSSGRVITALGPNSSGSSGTNLSQPGNAQLQALVNGTTYDAAILRFNFIPASDIVEFRYVFASDEYPEYANSNYNDVFAFFISGGPENYNNYNIARIPGTNTPVTINTVNHTQNSQYYVSNWSPSTINIEYDGFTKPFTAMAAVTPCQVYTMTLGVADVYDGIYDSAVFLEAGSFFSGASVQADNISGVGGENDIWEGCSNTYMISLVEGADNSQDIVIDVAIDHTNSTAVEGQDFTTFPTQLVIPAGETSVSFDYSAYDIEDGDIYFIVSFFTSCPCGNIPADPIVDTIWIYDFEFVKGGIQDVQTLYCGADAPATLTLEGKTNLDPEIFYFWSTGDTGPSTVINTQFGATTYYLTMADVCGNELYDEITIKISDINVAGTSVSHPSCNNACNGSFQINMDGTFTPFQYRYANENWVYWPDSVHLTAYNTFTHLCPANYKLTVTDAIGCFNRMDFTIPNPPPVSQAPGLLDNDMDFCEDPGQITLTAASNQPNPIYQWNNGQTTPSITVTPNTGENTYWVKILDGCGNFKQDEIKIRYSDIDINVNTTIDMGDCSGSVSAFATNGIWPYVYFWEAPISSFNPTHSNLCAGYYTVKVTDGINCQKSKEIYIEEYNTVPQNDTENLFSIYPNPSSGEFVIDYYNAFKSNVSIRIVDIQGRVLSNFKLETDKVVVGGYSAGVYFIELLNNNEMVSVKKLVITN